jgi:AcrR family transcriptional regulator
MTVRAAKIPRGEKTRERIIEVAIACIAQKGYSGATTEVIAREADMTRGPLQYYFADRVSLVYAVFERLHANLMTKYAEGVKGADTPHALVEKLLDVTYNTCRSDEHYAIIEIIVASRSDQALRALIEPTLMQANAKIDNAWPRAFGGVRGDEHLQAARYLVVALNRGLALNCLTFQDADLFERDFALTRKIAHDLFGTTPP